MVYHRPTLDRTFSALADPVRRTMLMRLARGAATVTELGAPHRLTLAGVLKHVRYLESAGLVDARKEGRSRVCRLVPRPLASAVEWLEQYRIFWEGQLDSLERFLTLPRAPGNDQWPTPPHPSRSKSAASSPSRRKRSSPPGPRPKR